jgi:hypothetical protein
LSLAGPWTFNQDANTNNPAPGMTVDGSSASSSAVSIRFCTGSCSESGFYGGNQYLASEQTGHSNCAIPFANNFPSTPALSDGHKKISLGNLSASTAGQCSGSFDTIDVHVQGYACFTKKTPRPAPSPTCNSIDWLLYSWLGERGGHPAWPRGLCWRRRGLAQLFRRSDRARGPDGGDGYTAWVNSKALALAGLQASASGVLTGEAASSVRRLLPKPGEAEYREAFGLVSKQLNELGITSVVDANAADRSAARACASG